MKRKALDIPSLEAHWSDLKPLLSVYRTQADYNRAVSAMDQLLDLVGDDEGHPLASLLETIGVLVEAYEKQNYPQPTPSAVEALRLLMAEHALSQNQLPEIGSQGVVSEVLSGRRELNKRQVIALARRFGVSPLVFLDGVSDDQEAA
ncbi:MAG: transcriptional regulator [bacterium]|nr:transcriptional regulator [bacterium]